MRRIAVLSQRRAAAATFGADIVRFQARYAALWWQTPTDPPAVGEPVDRRRQRRTERATDRLVDELEQALGAYPASSGDQSSWEARLRGRLRDFARHVLGLPESHCDVVFADEYFTSTARFAHSARAFADWLRPEDLFQALRNVWIMNLFQMFLGMRIALTPSIFAYSMLYPLTDNYLDDSAFDRAAKEAFSSGLERRLAGERPAPANPHEEAIFRLVGHIEGQYPRRQYPRVFHSLLAIHRAQTASLAQEQRSSSPYEVDVLGISLAKGGASVLADGYLVAGELSPEEADFFFGYGTFLQLLDDLQDVDQDLAGGRVTIFSQTARRWPLDRITSRLYHYLVAILESSPRFSGPRFAVLRELVRSNCAHLILQAVACHNRLFSAEYLRWLERYSLTRFACARKKRRTILRRYQKATAALAHDHGVHSLFELMGAGEAIRKRSPRRPRRFGSASHRTGSLLPALLASIRTRMPAVW